MIIPADQDSLAIEKNLLLMRILWHTRVSYQKQKTPLRFIQEAFLASNEWLPQQDSNL